MTPRPDSATAIALPGLSAVYFRGRDSEAFLQGQLSNDLRSLEAEFGLLAGLHNAQGRVLALLRLARLADGAIAALLPADLAPAIAAHLQRYVLRAQVRIDKPAAGTVVAGLATGEGRHYRLLEAAHAMGDVMAARHWHLDDLRAGLPQIYAATSGLFTAQQLNLDTLGAISFSKGCYTGQEIIARTHYRGQVKRRMQQLSLPAPPAAAGQVSLPVPGSEVALPAGGMARVIDSEQTEDARCELLVLAANPQP